MTQQDSIRVLIADGSSIIVEALSSSIKSDGRISVVGTASSAIELITIAQALEPDLILSSVHLASTDGAECVSTLRLLLPNVRIIVFSVYDLLMTRIIFLEAGANAVVQGNHLPERIATEIQRLFPSE